MSPLPWIEAYVQPGWVYVDIGANVGSLANKAHEKGATVYAIEPCAQTVDMAGQQKPHLQWMNYAIGDCDKPVTLYHSEKSEQHSLWDANCLTHEGSELVVQRSLDSLLAGGAIPLPDLIKVDTQGAEALVLAGAKNLIAQKKAWWILELWKMGLEAAGSSLQDIKALIDSYGLELVDDTWENVLESPCHRSPHGSVDILLRPCR